MAPEAVQAKKAAVRVGAGGSRQAATQREARFQPEESKALAVEADAASRQPRSAKRDFDQGIRRVALRQPRRERL